MDITSYLLGKKASGGGGGSDWSEIGYTSEPQSITDDFNYAKQIYDNWDESTTSGYMMFKDDKNLVYMPLVNTENITDTQLMFNGCTNLAEFPKLNFSKVKSALNMFFNCYKLKTIPELDFSSITTVKGLLSSCSAIENLGGFKNLGEAYLTTSSENYSNYKLSLTSCTNLTHESLMNVINDLYDIKTKGCNNQSLELGSTNLAKLTAEEIAIATNKGWNVS